MSYVDKLALARKLIEEHNSVLDDPADHVSVTDFEKKLKKIGGSTETALKECTWEDLEHAGLPRILARKVATVFRSDAKTDPNYVTPEGAAGMHPLYLLQKYNPQDPNSPVAKRLSELSRGQKFIVFVSGSQTVNAEASHKLLQEIMKGYPARDEFEIDGKFVRTYAVGDSLGEYVDENPLYPGRALRPDGVCDQTNRSWEGIPLSVRQLVYLAVGKFGTTIDKAHDLIDLAVSPNAEAKLRQRYAKASVELEELNDAGNAPKLKIKLGANTATAKNDPFKPYSRNRTY